MQPERVESGNNPEAGQPPVDNSTNPAPAPVEPESNNVEHDVVPPQQPVTPSVPQVHSPATSAPTTSPVTSSTGSVSSGPVTPSGQSMGPSHVIAAEMSRFGEPDVVVSSPVVSGTLLPEPDPKAKTSGSWGVRGRPVRKSWLFSGFLLFAVLAGGLVYGVYLPSRPASVYKTSMSRTGMALDKLVETNKESNIVEKYKTTQLSGTLTGTDGSNDYDSNFTVSLDSTSSDTKAKVTVSSDGQPAKQLDFNLLTSLPKGASVPDIYLKFSGIKALGLDQFVPALGTYDNKWIYASSSYMSSFSEGIVPTTVGSAQPTAQELNDLAQKMTDVTNKYLFTNNSENAVLKKESYVGKETVDGVHAYHYKVTIQKDNAKEYCVELSRALIDSKAYAKLVGLKNDQLTKARDDARDACSGYAADAVKNIGTIDMWVDSKYKLVHKFRFHEKQNKKSYLDIGQRYTGGDDISLFGTVHSDTEKSDLGITMKNNIKTYETSATVSYKSTNSDNKTKFDLKLQAKPVKDAVQITKPAPVTNIQDVLKALGIGGL